MSKSWQLLNASGNQDMVRGEMDISFFEGGVVEITAPNLVLDQKIRKCSMEPQGSNRFAPGWGSVFRKVLGSKNISDSILRVLAQSTVDMMDSLINIQQSTQARITLAPEELIASVAGIAIVTNNSKISVRPNIISQANEELAVTALEIPSV